MGKAVVILTVIFIFALFFLLKPAFTGTGKTIENVNYDDFAKCLNDKGIVIYGTDWSALTLKQKEIFGESFQYINYVNCDYNGEVCDAKGVENYPVWEINSGFYPGLQNPKRLSKVSGCDI